MIVFAPVATFVILSVLKLFFGSLRVNEEEEGEGLDLSQHSESAYTTSAGGSMANEGFAGPHGAMAREHELA